MPDLSPSNWAIAILAAMSVGVAKSGLAGIGVVPVVMFAGIFGARDSTGITLPVLIAGDLLAAAVYRRHADWTILARMLPPACLGVAAAAWGMRSIDETQFRPLLGVITLGLIAAQVLRDRWPDRWVHVPHSMVFAWLLGLLAGTTTMLANAAGPILVVYALAIGLTKMTLVGTVGWFFLLINLFKVPFSASLGLLNGGTVMFAVWLFPAVAAGLWVGRWVIVTLPQHIFNNLLLAGAGLASLRLLGVL